MEPVGRVIIGTAGGQKETTTHHISIGLPHGVGFPSLIANKADLVGGNDVLIGMDIISQGDFAVTNFNGRTAFSFRMPSVEQLDFVTKRPHSPTSIDLASLPEVGRNDPCPCGSGKKYKRCHGK